MTHDTASAATSSGRKARDIGIPMGTLPNGPLNAITDVAGVTVGHTTLIEGEGPLQRGKGPIRTGVTVVLPRPEPWYHPVFAAPHRINGNGELTGLEWVRESGLLSSYIALTNTHSVGVVRDALVEHEATMRARTGDDDFFALPVVGETYDGGLNDINGFHVRPEHVHQAIAAATGGHVAEGSVGGGTGMVCHGFKGGIGTASRVTTELDAQYTIGVLVQANHGAHDRLAVDGTLVGPKLPIPQATSPKLPEGSGSIIVIIATDAPLLPHQCARLAKRAAFGIARTGGAGENGSGDFALCFSTANPDVPAGFGPDLPASYVLNAIPNDRITPLMRATIEATEEAIVNAMLAADTMVGLDGVPRYGLPAADLLAALGLQ